MKQPAPPLLGEGAGAGELFATVTVTLLLVVLFPAASRATAESVWDPFPTVAVFQEAL
jgi:hypothetical protein